MTLVRIQEAARLDGYRVRLRLTDGRVIERDLAEHLTGPVFADIRSIPERFQEFRVEAGTLVWPGGADLCPDVLIWAACRRRPLSPTQRRADTRPSGQRYSPFRQSRGSEATKRQRLSDRGCIARPRTPKEVIKTSTQ